MSKEYSDLVGKLSQLKKQARKHGLLVMSFDTEFMIDKGYMLKPEVAVDLLEQTIDDMNERIDETLTYNL